METLMHVSMVIYILGSLVGIYELRVKSAELRRQNRLLKEICRRLRATDPQVTQVLLQGFSNEVQAATPEDQREIASLLTVLKDTRPPER